MVVLEISFNLICKVLGEESEPQPLFDESLVNIGPPTGVEVQQVAVLSPCHPIISCSFARFKDSTTLR